MDHYNLFYKGVKLNKKPLTEKEADNEIGLIIITYGYKPEKINNCTDEENRNKHTRR